MPDAYDLSRQARWETECWRRASKLYREAVSARSIDELPPGKRLLRECIEPFAAAIVRFQKEGLEAHVEGGSGRRPAWSLHLQLLHPQKLALMTLTLALRSTTGETGASGSITALAETLCRTLRDQIEYEKWEKDTVESGKRNLLAAFQRRYPDADRAVWARWRRKVEVTRLAAWEPADVLTLGGFLLNLLCETCPKRFRIGTRPGKHGKTNKVLEVTPETVELIDDLHTRAEVARPLRMPMVIPPIPWRIEE